MDKRPALPREALQDEPLAAEETRAHALGEGHLDLDVGVGAEERVLLAQELAAEVVELHGNNLAGIRGRERDVALALPLVDERGDE